MNDHYCKRCKNRNQNKFGLSISGPHVKLTCLKCNTFVKFIKKEHVPSNLILLDVTMEYVKSF
jgi:RNase P subunit RPR2